MKKLVLSLILSFTYSFFFAQSNDRDKLYTPNSTSLFNTNPNSNNNVNSNSYHSELKNLIKFGPTMLFRQKFAIFYEREIAKSISIIIGVGKAFGDDVFQKAFLEIIPTYDDNSALHPDGILGNAKYYSSTPLLSSSIRIYMSDNVFDDSYIELNYRNETMVYLLNDNYVRDLNYITGDRSVSFKMNSFAFGFGYNSLFGPKKNFSSDFFINFGIKFFNFDKIEKTVLNNAGGYGGTNQYYAKTNTTLKAKVLPSINIGYAFGFGF